MSTTELKVLVNVDDVEEALASAGASIKKEARERLLESVILARKVEEREHLHLKY